MILPRTLKAAAAPNPDPKGDNSDPETELLSLSTVPELEVSCFLALWDFLVLGSPVKVPGPPSYTIRIHRRSEHCRHAIHAFDININ